jgi:thioredoxin 1
MPIAITQDNFKKEIEESALPVVLDVYAIWCGPCQQMAPIVDELEKELQGKYKFAKLNVDEARESLFNLVLLQCLPLFLSKIDKLKVKKQGI